MRFVAALMVFLSHYPIPGAPYRLRQIANSGYAGVTFFFVLSGFILAYNYTEGFVTDARRQLGPYAVSRFARVYPLYLVTTLYMWFIADGDVDLWRYVLALQPWSSDINVAFGLNGPSWSIGVEAFLYAAFPAIVICLHKLGVLGSRRRMVMVGCVIVAIMLCLAYGFVLSGGSALHPSGPGIRAQMAVQNPRRAHS